MLDTFLSYRIVRSNIRKKYNNEYLQTKKSRIAHFSCQFVVLLIAVGWPNKSFLLVLVFREWHKTALLHTTAVPHLPLHCQLQYMLSFGKNILLMRVTVHTYCMQLQKNI